MVNSFQNLQIPANRAPVRTAGNVIRLEIPFLVNVKIIHLAVQGVNTQKASCKLLIEN